MTGGSDVSILGNTFNNIAQYMFKLTNAYGIGLKNLFYNSTNSLNKYFSAQVQEQNSEKKIKQKYWHSQTICNKHNK